MSSDHSVTQREDQAPADATLMSSTDGDSRVRYANAAFAAASGFHAQEMIGEPNKLVRHPHRPRQAFADMRASASSHKIGDNIGVIEGLAFQTNILALNAAVGVFATGSAR